MRATIAATLVMMLLGLPAGTAGDKKAEAERDELRAKLLKLEKAHKAELAKRDEQINDLKAALVKLAEEKVKAADANVAIQRLTAEAQRFKEEANLLLETLKKREARLVDLQERLAKQADEFRTGKSEAKKLLDRNVELLLLIKKLEQRKDVPAAAPAPDGKPNPPPGKVKGAIQRIHPSDTNVVHLSVGLNQGVKVDHTLEVYRSKPKAEYLGMIRIIESLPERSVGQRLASSMNLGPFMIGDQVVGKIELPK